MLEINGDEAAKFVGEPTLEKIEYVEVLSLLKEDPNDFAGIFKIKFKDPNARLSDFPMNEEGQVQLLQSNNDGSYVFYYRGAPQNGKRMIGSWPSGGFLSMPFEIREGKLIFTFLGSVEEVKAVFRFLRKAGVRYGVKSLADPKFSSSSPLSLLTDRQRKVITTAFKLGYYDIPRRIGSDELARNLGIGNPTFVMHRRKAERRLLADLLNEH
jgi:predicted DNA binding protein